MKFFKFVIEVYDFDRSGSKYFSEIHFINVEDIKEIIISSNVSNDKFVIRTRGGSVFHIKNNYLERLLKLVDIDEKEVKKFVDIDENEAKK